MTRALEDARDDVEVLEFGNELDCLTVPLSCGHIVGFDPVAQ